MTPEGIALTEGVDGRIHVLAIRGELTSASEWSATGA